MKKAFTILATLAAAGALASAANETYTSSSVLTNTSENPNTLTTDLYSAMLGKTTTEVNTLTGVYAAEMKSSNLVTTKTFTLNSLYNAVELPDAVALTSYSFITHRESISNSKVMELYVQVKQGDTLLGTSSSFVYADDAQDNDFTTFSCATATFSSSITLQTDEAYTFQIVTKNANDTYTDYNGVMYIGTVNPIYGSSNKDTSYLVDGGSGAHAIVSVSTKAIPEPATASLSLLALAGLAARRRRK